ncbi:MAG: MFS transporter [Pseudomonadota bacterium]|nr:MFS transporter [Pseudomonadota bacterium]
MSPAQHAPESRHAWLRLALALVLGTTACVGTWSVVVVLPAVQAEFGSLRAGASMPYAAAMIGFAGGTLTMGRVADRTGFAAPIAAASLCLFIGYELAALAQSLWQFTLIHSLIGFGAAAGFAPLIADLSHWFVKHRGIAVTVAASGSYLAGAVWPQAIQLGLTSHGWRATHVAIGIAALVVMLPLSLFFRARPTEATLAKAERATQAARGDLAMSPRALQALLGLAGFACCVAMSMPQVHIVAYCSDLGYGIARGAEMLTLMLGLGIVSRLGSGFVADRIGAVGTLVLGSVMQAVALFLYLWFDGLASLYVIAALFGLFQGGIVPMYAVIIRDYLPPREAGARIGLVLTATILGMAFGGYLSGAIFDLFASYRIAFLNGVLWNLLNIALMAWLMLKPQPRLHPA